MTKTLNLPRGKRLRIDPAKPYKHPVLHSPKSWPSWKRFSIKVYPTDGCRAGWRSYNVWVYWRNGAQCTWVCYDNGSLT